MFLNVKYCFSNYVPSIPVVRHQIFTEWLIGDLANINYILAVNLTSISAEHTLKITAKEEEEKKQVLYRHCKKRLRR